MNINNITLLACFLVSFVFVGCFKERIELDLNNENSRKLVINAWLTNDEEVQSVNLSYTTDYFDQITKDYENDAEVIIKEGETETTLIHTGNGEYLLPENWKGEVGNTYEINVKIEDQTYKASSQMKMMPEVENIFSRISEDYDSESEEQEEEFYDVFFSFRDNSGEGDGYYGVVYNKGTLSGDSIVNGDFIEDDLIDGTYFEDVDLTSSKHYKGDTVVLELHAIGQDAVFYLSDIREETFRGGLFDPAPVNVRSNFSNGALGYFITSGVRKIEHIIK